MTARRRRARAEKLARWAAGGHPLADAAWWWLRRRCLAADPAVCAVLVPLIGQDRSHPLTGRARATLAELWRARGLLDTWFPDADRAVARLIADPDQTLREAAAGACRQAHGARLDALWLLTDRPRVEERSRQALVAELAANPHPLSDQALGLAWRRCLRTWDDALWKLLRRDGRPASREPDRRLSRLALAAATPAELCSGALAADTPEPVRDLVLAACRQAGHAPEEPVQRALLFLLTGRPEQHRALDPDGSLLALGYHGAAPALRERLRAAMVGSGDLDLVRIVTGDRTRRLADMSADERRYLVDGLADRADWVALWRMALDLPLAEAVRAAAVLRAADDWQPPRDGERALLHRLASTEAERVDAVVRALPSPGASVIRLDPGEEPEACAVAPDGRELVVATRTAAGQQLVRWFTLPGGALVASVHRTQRAHEIVHTGHFAIAAEGPNAPILGRNDRLTGYTPDGARPVATGASITVVRPTGSGFVALVDRGTLLFGGHDDPLPHRRVELDRDLRLTKSAAAAFVLATEVSAGLIAVVGYGLVVIDERTLTVRGSARFGPGPTRRNAQPITRLTDVAFVAPDRLVTMGGSSWRSPVLQGWLLAGTRLTPQARARLHPSRPVQMAAAPSLGRILLREDRSASPELRDAATLEVADLPVPSVLSAPLGVWSSPSGRCVLGHGSTLEVHAPVWASAAALLAEPMADRTPQDLAALRRIWDVAAPRTELADLVEVFRSCLEHRFAAEITLATAAPPPGPDESDIALSGEDR